MALLCLELPLELVWQSQSQFPIENARRGLGLLHSFSVVLSGIVVISPVQEAPSVLIAR